MYYLDEKMIQVWKEDSLYLLINHYWRGTDYFLKNGFKSLYQKVSYSQLEALKKLETSTEEERIVQIGIIGKTLYEKLIKHKFLIKDCERDEYKAWDYSVAGDNLAPYLSMQYGIDYPMGPTKVQFLLTQRCFGNCSFCITNSKVTSEMIELSDDDWETIAKRICNDLNPCQVDLIGGEPLIRFEAAKRVCKILVENNVLVRIITNGVVLADLERCKELAEILQDSKHYIQISIDGDEEIHNKLRPGARYDKVLMAMKNIDYSGMAWGSNLTVTKENLYKTEEIIDKISKYNPIHFEIGPLQTSVKDIELCKKIVLDNKDENELRMIIDKSSKRYKKIDFVFNKREKIFLTGAKPIGAGRKYQDCSAFRKLLSISADGRLISCLRGCVHPELYGENIVLWEESLQKLWKESRLSKIFRNIEIKGKCKSCGFNQQCNQGCPLETYVLKGVLGGFDPDCQYDVQQFIEK
jgi:radical SAM protein with 4Fe4S-binding SPASM domain